MERALIFETAVYLAFAVPSCVSDIRSFRISLPLIFLGALLLFSLRIFGFALLFGLSPDFFLSAGSLVLAALTSALLFLLVRKMCAGGMGLGDVFFAAFTAVYCGFHGNLVAAALSALSGLLFFLLASLFGKKNRFGRRRRVLAVPFVPFITFGALLSRLFF